MEYFVLISRSQVILFEKSVSQKMPLLKVLCRVQIVDPPPPTDYKVYAYNKSIERQHRAEEPGKPQATQ